LNASRAIGPRLRAIITPNYDLLFEEALGRVGTTFRYAGTQAGPASVAVYKINGSVNFFLPSGAGGGATIEQAQASAKMLRVAEQDPMPTSRKARPFESSRRVSVPHWTTESMTRPGRVSVISLAASAQKKEYWSRDSRERESMARFGFVGRDGWFSDLVKSVESGRE
jgi:hypothetical protein